jgi:hypothetical protein
MLVYQIKRKKENKIKSRQKKSRQSHKRRE